MSVSVRKPTRGLTLAGHGGKKTKVTCEEGNGNREADDQLEKDVC